MTDKKSTRPSCNDELAQQIREANIRLHNLKAEEFDQEEVHMQKDRFIRIARQCVADISARIKSEEPSLLDIGCGTGNLSKMFQHQGFEVTGLDISAGMLEVYRRKCGDQVKTVLSDADAFFASNQRSYDVISFSAVLHHLPDYLGTVQRSLKFLKPGGILFINHEHLSFDSMSGPSRFLQNLDIKLYGILYKWRYQRNEFAGAVARKLGLAKPANRSDDIRLADYHVFEGGVQEQQIIDTLKENNLEILRFLPYQQLRLDSLNALAGILKWDGLFCLIAHNPLSD